MKTRSEESRDRQQHRNRVIISVLIIILMVFSTFGYAFYYFTGGSTTTNLNGHKFTAIADQNGIIQGYTTKINGQTLQLYAPPAEVSSIEVPIGFADSIKGAEGIIFLFDPADNLTPMYDQIRFDLSKIIVKPQGAGVTNATTKYPFPVLSCNNATANYPFIMFTQGNKSITYKDRCFVVSGGQYDYPALSDRIVYAYYGII